MRLCAKKGKEEAKKKERKSMGDESKGGGEKVKGMDGREGSVYVCACVCA